MKVKFSYLLFICCTGYPLLAGIFVLVGQRGKVKKTLEIYREGVYNKPTGGIQGKPGKKGY